MATELHPLSDRVAIICVDVSVYDLIFFALKRLLSAQTRTACLVSYVGFRLFLRSRRLLGMV